MVVLGDQLDPSYPSAVGLDPDLDAILMMEVRGQSTDPPSHVQRTVLFLSAMRHHAEVLRSDGWRVEYVSLTQSANTHTLDGEIQRAVDRLRPKELCCIQPGSYSVLEEIESACAGAGVPLEIHEDPHFLCTVADFEKWASGRKQLILEYFYREMRRKLGVLVEPDGKPIGGQWNYDKDNRKRFKTAPDPPAIPRFPPDETTAQVIEDVRRVLPDLPGSLEAFAWPVSREQALDALADFIEHRLPKFGDFQDAMWTGETTLYHSLLAPALNMKLLDPREVYQAALDAHESGAAPLNCVEGFVRQIIGWREFIRGVYWTQGPQYEASNALDQTGRLPGFYWDGETDMRCMGEALGSVLDSAYGHHIARLMVTGNFALIAGVDPQAVNDWYRGMYADAVDWVTAPNTLGMAMHADGGIVGTKPYAASGKYIDRMSNYCKGCRYDVKERTGDDACPFNTFYWDFLIRNRETFRPNQRMAMILKNVDRLAPEQVVEITTSAAHRRSEFGI